MTDKCDIDFVLPWVDGSDPEWLSQFQQYVHLMRGDKRNYSKSRFRDWDNLHFLFRSFEKCTPWVRKIHFVTWGHLPEWLNAGHEKINVIKHDDFIDNKCLPVFSSHPIELNMHRIPNLSERFVYFNDDTFVLKKMNKERFFKDGLPRDMLTFNAISDSMIANVKINDIHVIHRHFEKYQVVRNNFFKIFNYRSNLLELLKTVLLMPWPKITGFYDPHLPQAFLKSTFFNVWEKELDLLNETTRSKFRSCSDVNQFLFRYWHLCNGDFMPVGFRRNYVEWVRNYEDALKFKSHLASGRYDMACINDGVLDENDFKRIKETINCALEDLFPDKSSFEK